MTARMVSDIENMFGSEVAVSMTDPSSTFT